MTTVMVVEDIPAFALDVEQRILESHPDWEVRIHDSPEEVRAALDNGDVPDIALIDLDLGLGPNRSGLDVLALLAEAYPEVKTVVHTADVEPNRWLLVLASSALFSPDGYISKSAPTHRLLEVLTEVTQGRRIRAAGAGDEALRWFRSLIGNRTTYSLWRTLSSGAQRRDDLTRENYVSTRTVARFLAAQCEVLAAAPPAATPGLKHCITMAQDDNEGRPTHFLALSTLATMHPLVFQSDVIADRLPA